MCNKYSKFINWAKNNNWVLIEKSEHSFNISDEVKLKYKSIPNEYVEFLKIVKRLIAPSEKTWFLCEDEYNNNSDTPFKWNEFELLSLEAAGEDDNWKEDISLWWEKFFPIILSVDEEYSFYAIDLRNSNGVIVKGSEPEFEEVEEVADNIEHFFELIMSNNITIY